ncbi:MAG TPA: hypothetical protein VFU06_11770, partial [Longimicrobiales bacterium]|nr:hypothetical protein [Longimicrobiales bacterium]
MPIRRSCTAGSADLLFGTRRAYCSGARGARAAWRQTGSCSIPFLRATYRAQPRGQLDMAYPFQLPDLPYANNALEPHIDAR